MDYSFTSTSMYLSAVLIPILLWYLLSRPSKKLPPGLPSLPLVGSLPFMGTDLVQTFHRLYKKHGDVFSFQFRGSATVVLCSYDVIRKCLVEQGHKVNARPQGIITEDVLRSRGTFTRIGKDWKDLRTFVHNVLRQFGGRSAIMEQRVKEEVMYLAEAIQQHGGQPLDMWRLLTCSVANVVTAIGVGSRYDYEDEKFHQLLGYFDQTVALTNPAGLLSVFPLLRWVPGDLFGYVSLKKNISDIRGVMKEHIHGHRKTFDPADTRDLIDMFIMQQHKEGNAIREIFTDEELCSVLQEFLSAGTETTATALNWMILYLILYPDVQKKLFHEIESVAVGDMKYQMSTDMPYTLAFIQESQRMAGTNTVSLPRFALEDVEVNDYVIPKGSTVMPFFGTVHGDATLWTNPEIFNPERFIDEDGNFIKRDEILSFSLGPRVCVGESLARMELFFHVTGLVRKYEILPIDGAPLPTTEAVAGLTRKPKPFKVRFVPR